MKILLTLHLISAVFLIGPLAAAGIQGIRVTRAGDAGGLRATTRLVTIYGWASLAVLVFGLSLVQGKDRGVHVAFGEGWVIASLILFVLAFGLVIGVLRPALRSAVALVEAGQSSAGLTGRVAASSGVVSLLYLALVVLMVYRP
ncbi:MAG TPA: DUF2269 family protein [Mycobacteriales bacterium]|nr:DUF2269 family protein [Mycobacteriales bacterium]